MYYGKGFVFSLDEKNSFQTTCSCFQIFLVVNDYIEDLMSLIFIGVDLFRNLLYYKGLPQLTQNNYQHANVEKLLSIHSDLNAFNKLGSMKGFNINTDKKWNNGY